MAKITPCFQNRKSAIAENLKGGIGAGTTEFHVLRCNKNLLPKYLLFFLKSSYLICYGVGHFKGTAGQQRIGTSELKNCAVPIPSLNEQRRIVAKLEESFAEIDRAEKAYRELQTLTAILRKKILQEAVMGKLVPQLDGEPAVEQIGDAPEVIPFEIPKKWKWATLDDCVVFNPKIQSDDDADVSFIPMQACKAGYVSKLDVTDVRKWKTVKKGFSKFQDQDVLMAKITPCFQNRKSAIAENLKGGIGAGTTEFHVLRCNKNLLPKYLLFFLKSSYLIRYGVENFKGTAGQQRIETSELKNCAVPVPSLNEQRRIVAKVEELMAQVDRLAT